MARIQRMHMEYVAAEDRIRLSVRTTEPTEVRCWLTRRFTRELWQALDRTMADAADVAGAPPGERAARLARRHARATADATSATPSTASTSGSAAETDDPQLPLGAAPLLVSRLRIRRTARGHQLSLLPPDEQDKGLHIDMDEMLLHRLVSLLARAVRQTQWDLDIASPDLDGVYGEVRAGDRLH